MTFIYWKNQRIVKRTVGDAGPYKGVERTVGEKMKKGVPLRYAFSYN